jgi:hypothetical protein
MIDTGTAVQVLLLTGQPAQGQVVQVIAQEGFTPVYGVQYTRPDGVSTMGYFPPDRMEVAS